MGERPSPSSQIDTEDRSIQELELLYTDPHKFTQKYNGTRPLIAGFLGIREGFMVDGTDFPQRHSIQGVVVFYRPGSDDSILSLRARLNVAELRTEFGAGISLVTVRTREDYPYLWNPGPILPEDLERDIATLKAEAVAAERVWDTGRTSLKLRAILAQIQWSERDSAPSWQEIFLDPHA